jgi:polyhydroxyalkanoate synthase subunit PhaC
LTVSAADFFAQAGQTLASSFLNILACQADPTIAQQIRGAETGSPELAALQAQLVQQHLALWSSMLARDAGKQVQPIARADNGDRRFSGAEWSTSPHFDYLRQAYLINTRYLRDYVEALALDPLGKGRLRFAVRQLTDAMSPANFAATNPEALKLALDTEGRSLSQGLMNLVEDVHRGRISTTEESAFEVGRNLATSEGAVIFENELFQLIQYRPLTQAVRKRPLLIVPPCINKFYVLDLQPENSFVRYAVEQGNTVFMVSWRNVLEPQGHYTWDDYLSLGVLKALETVRELSAVAKPNVIGYCVGGTMLGAALAVLQARGEDWVESVTFFTALHDFSDAGEIGLFVDEPSVAAREAAIGAGGVMPGRELAMVFSALRANDLVWSYVVNNYLKGRSPGTFDLLHWNADSTNLPGPMYCWYVRNMYLENNLTIPDKLTMLGEPVDLARVRYPTYVVATREDHIVPWKSAYRTTQLMRGEMRFVLGASGHIAGVVNPAAKNRRSYWVSEKAGTQPPADSEAWLAAAEEHSGSWWTDWNAWLERFSGGSAKARKTLGSSRYKPIEPAPGRYVKQRVT